MTLLRKGRDPRPIVSTCGTCGALNKYEIELGDTSADFNCGHCGLSDNYYASYFYKEEKEEDEKTEQDWQKSAAQGLAQEKVDNTESDGTL